MGERYYEGKHFSASPEAAGNVENEDMQQEQAEQSFLHQYNIPETVHAVYEEIHGEGEQLDPKTRQRLYKHLQEEFADTVGDTETIQEAVTAEIRRFLKMSS